MLSTDHIEKLLGEASPGEERLRRLADRCDRKIPEVPITEGESCCKKRRITPIYVGSPKRKKRQYLCSDLRLDKDRIEEIPSGSPISSHAETDSQSYVTPDAKNMGNEMPIHLGSPGDWEDDDYVPDSQEFPIPELEYGLLQQDGGSEQVLGRLRQPTVCGD